MIPSDLVVRDLNWVIGEGMSVVSNFLPLSIRTLSDSKS